MYSPSQSVNNYSPGTIIFCMTHSQLRLDLPFCNARRLQQSAFKLDAGNSRRGRNTQVMEKIHSKVEGQFPSGASVWLIQSKTRTLLYGGRWAYASHA